MKRKSPAQTITLCAVVAGVYTILCFAFPMLSYGPVQIRIAEALTLLAVFSPTMIVAVTIGCFLANLVGLFVYPNPMVLDLIFGTLATGIAATLTYLFRNVRIRNYPVLSVLPPVLINAVIIGAEITLMEFGSIFGAPPLAFGGFALSVGLGQIIPCMVVGPILVRALESTGVADRYLIPQRA